LFATVPGKREKKGTKSEPTRKEKGGGRGGSL